MNNWTLDQIMQEISTLSGSWGSLASWEVDRLLHAMALANQTLEGKAENPALG